MDGYSVPDAEKRRLAEAWLAAHYHACAGPAHWPLRIGAPAPALEAAWPARSYLLITAWNPPGQRRSDVDNRAADARLRRRLDDAGRACIRASADDGAGGWREPGWLVADLHADEADHWAREFEQGGVLFWFAGAPVTLRLQWTRPADAPDSTAIAWVGGCA